MVRLIIAVLLVGMVFAAGYIMGMYTRPSRGKKLSRPERRELGALRDFKVAARRNASTHQLLEGESSLAQIILDEVDKTDKEIDSARATD